MRGFREAVEAQDLQAIDDLLADDVVFTSPVAFKPYPGKAITGCDFIHTDADGLIDDFMVMVRPLSAAQALAERMGARFDDIVQRAGARS